MRIKRSRLIVLLGIIVGAMLLVSACANHDVANEESLPTYRWVSTSLYGVSGEMDPYKSGDYYLGDFVPDGVELRTQFNTYVLEKYEPETPEEGYTYLKFTWFKGTDECTKAEEYVLKYVPTLSAGPYLRYNARFQTIEPCCFEKEVL